MAVTTGGGSLRRRRTSGAATPAASAVTAAARMAVEGRTAAAEHIERPAAALPLPRSRSFRESAHVRELLEPEPSAAGHGTAVSSGRMAATLPDLETVNLRRGASNGAELRIELNRPERMNAWDKQLGLDLLAAVELAAADTSVRCVTITGAGRAFSSGADLRAGFDPTPEGRPDVGTALRERYHPIITGVRRMPKPVLAAVNGPAVGIGCSLALACDLVLARESAYLLLAFVNIGLVPDGGSSVFIPARVGAGRAARWRCSVSGSRRRRR